MISDRRKITQPAVMFLAAVTNTPLYLISCLVKKKKNLWLFSARKGKAYAENPKYFYEHITKHYPGVEAIWITKSARVLKALKKDGKKCVFAYSPTGYYLSARAQCVFYSNFSRREMDFNDYTTSPKTYRFQLWHGSPVKKIGCQRPYVKQRPIKRATTNIAKLLFPFWKNRGKCHKIIAASPQVARSLEEAFQISRDRILICNYPKNDRWLSRIQKQRKIKNIIYMPTWRVNEPDNLELISARFKFDPKRLDLFCKERGIKLTIKAHPFVADYFRRALNTDDHTNIKTIETEDIYESLHQYDVLITDYSSIALDFLLSDRPIIYAPFDKEKYESNEGFIYDIESISAGPIAKDWADIERLIDANPAEFKEQRKKIRSLFNTHIDTFASERLLKLVETETQNRTAPPKLVGPE